jgi:imidazolonepropionase-like amidohydrolase
MKLSLAMLLLLAPAAVFHAARAGQRRPGGALVLTRVTVVDVSARDAAGALRRDQTVVVEGQRVTAVGAAGAVKVPPGARVVDAAGKYLIPGLWDMHVHLSLATELALPTLVANGVTGVRDMGGELEQLDGWRRRVSEGGLPGPRIVRAGPVVDGPKQDAPFRLTATTPAEARRAVAEIARRGADFVKVHNGLPRDAYFALADEARRRKLPLAGHVPKEVSPAEASGAGQLSIEHTESLFDHVLFNASREGLSQAEGLKRVLAAYRDEEAAALFRAFRRAGTWYDPVLVTYRSFAFRADFAASPDPRNRYAAAAMKSVWDKHQPVPKNLPAETAAARKAVFERLLELVGLMRREGVQILAGTDAGGIRDVVPGFSLHDELQLLVRAGLTPLEALRAATLNPAKFLRAEDRLGAVEKGKLADFVLLDANPLGEIGNTRRVNAVVLNGRLLERGELDAMLAEVEAAAGRR